MSSGGWDYLCAYENELYVSHGTQVNIKDKATDDSIGFIPNTTGIHGVAFDPIHKIGFTRNNTWIMEAAPTLTYLWPQ